MTRRQPRAHALCTAQQKAQMSKLLKTVSAVHPGADIRRIERAYAVAAQLHRGQLRYNGDPYITHPIEVATIIAKCGMRPEIVCAALLHDTVEDTLYTLGQLRQEFGEDIATLVDGVNSAEKLRQAEAAIKINANCASIAHLPETEVLALKLADRLHNMRTMRCLPAGKQQLKSRETLQVYAPVAHLLGMDTIKRELEDLASAILYPRVAERALAVSVMMLPPGTRAQKLEEWTAELSILPTRRTRARFVIQMLSGIPRIAVMLRPHARRDARWLTSTIVDRIVGALAIGGAFLAAVTHWEVTAWAASAMVLGGLVVLATVLFARSDDPARRLRGLIRAWRDPVSTIRSSRRRRNQSGPP